MVKKLSVRGNQLPNWNLCGVANGFHTYRSAGLNSPAVDLWADKIQLSFTTVVERRLFELDVLTLLHSWDLSDSTNTPVGFIIPPVNDATMLSSTGTVPPSCTSRKTANQESEQTHTADRASRDGDDSDDLDHDSSEDEIEDDSERSGDDLTATSLLRLRYSKSSETRGDASTSQSFPPRSGSTTAAAVVQDGENSKGKHRAKRTKSTRKRPNDNNEGSNEDSGDLLRRRKRAAKSKLSPDKQLACPFVKRYPAKFPRCQDKYYDTISRLK